MVRRIRSACGVHYGRNGGGFCAPAASAEASPERAPSAGSLSFAGYRHDPGGLPHCQPCRLSLRSLPIAALHIASSVLRGLVS